MSKIVQKHHICYLTGLVFLASISFFMLTLDNPAFADHVTVTVSLPQGTSVPGCQETTECFVPYEVTVDVGGKVTWSNDDTAVHTVTAGTPADQQADEPAEPFDSSLFMAGTTFSHTFESAGEFPYFCMLHPWMTGIVTVLSKESPNTQLSIKISGTTQSVSYTISRGSLSKITPDVDAKALIITVSTTQDGYLLINLPRSLIDSKKVNSDEFFFVLVDGEEVMHSETSKTKTSRLLGIDFPAGANEIEIIGTSLPSLESQDPICGAGTELINGICQKIKENQRPNYTVWIVVGVIIAAVVGGAVFAISRSRKSSKPRTITTTVSEPSSTQKGRECDVCSTIIPEGQNVCPNCGDTYSVKK